MNEICRDFLMSGEITNRRLHLLVSRSLVELFGTEVKRSQRNKVFFTIKLNIDLTGTMDIFPSITRWYSFNSLDFLNRIPSGSKLCFKRSFCPYINYIHTWLFIKFHDGRKSLLELNVEPGITTQDRASGTQARCLSTMNAWS